MLTLTSPVQTRLHSWPAGVKLGLLCLASMGLFALQDWRVHLVIAACILGGAGLAGRVFVLALLRPLRAIAPLVVIIAAWQAYAVGLPDAATVALRLVNALALANLVSLTTSLSAMMAVMGKVMRPFERVGLDPNVVELTFALTLRFLPVIQQKVTRLRYAWMARSRRPAGWRLIFPITVLALDDADQVARALAARGGVNPGKER